MPLMEKVIAKHMIHRRVGDHFEDISSGTPFMPQDEDELLRLRKAGCIYDSVEEKTAFERAAQGTVKRTKPLINRRKVPTEALHKEAAHKADTLAIGQLERTNADVGGEDGEGDGERIDENNKSGDAAAEGVAGRRLRRRQQQP